MLYEEQKRMLQFNEPIEATLYNRNRKFYNIGASQNRLTARKKKKKQGVTSKMVSIKGML